MTVEPDHLSPPGPTEPNTTAFAQTVDCRLVHRRSIAEVYVTAYAPAGPGRFTVFAQWPRDHRLYCPDGRYHPTLLLETMRQAVLAVCHGLAQVPLDRQFVISRITATGLSRLPRVNATPADVTLSLVRRAEIGRHRSHWDISIQVGPHALLSGGGDLIVVSWAQYARIRKGRAGHIRPATPSGSADPHTAGRTWVRDVVLTDPTDHPQLHIDQSHPIFYDHPLDHVPGALLLEAAFQRAHCHDPEFRPDGIDALFHTFIEPDEPCTVACAPTHATDTLVMRFDQHRSTKATITLQGEH